MKRGGGHLLGKKPRHASEPSRSHYSAATAVPKDTTVEGGGAVQNCTEGSAAPPQVRKAPRRGLAVRRRARRQGHRQRIAADTWKRSCGSPDTTVAAVPRQSSSRRCL